MQTQILDSERRRMALASSKKSIDIIKRNIFKK